MAKILKINKFLFLIVPVLMANALVMANTNRCISFYSNEGLVMHRIQKLSVEAEQIRAKAETMFRTMDSLISEKMAGKPIFHLIEFNNVMEQSLLNSNTKSEVESALAGTKIFRPESETFNSVISAVMEFKSNDNRVYSENFTMKYLIYRFALIRLVNLDAFENFNFSEFYDLGKKMEAIGIQLKLITPLSRYSDFNNIEALIQMTNNNRNSIQTLLSHNFENPQTLSESARWLLDKFSATTQLTAGSIDSLIASKDIPNNLKVLLENSKGLESLESFANETNSHSELTMDQLQNLVSKLYGESIDEREYLLEVQKNVRKYFTTQSKGN